MSDKIYNSILDTIGHTPILKLNRVVPEDAADVYVKLEFFNPGGSIRTGSPWQWLKRRKKKASSKAGDTIIEPLPATPGLAWRP